MPDIVRIDKAGRCFTLDSDKYACHGGIYSENASDYFLERSHFGSCRGASPYFIIFLLFISLVQGCSTDYILKSSQYDKYGGEINQHLRFIRADRSRLFQILTHEDAFREICPQGTIIHHKSPLPYQRGTLVQTRIEHIFKLSWNSRVEEFIPGEKIRLKFLDGFFDGGTELWEMEAAGEGTKIKHTIIFQPKGVLRKLAWYLKVRLKHDKMLEALLENLKAKAETEPD
jgi:ribosome-associated toxin RatA of RatAB toxin-antitoxin module